MLTDEERIIHHKEATKRYYEKNREKCIARAAKWNREHPEDVRFTNKKYQNAHREQIRAYGRKHYREKKEEKDE